MDAYQAGKDAYNLGEFDKARVALERAARIVPKAPGPHRYLAATAAAQKRWQRCLDHAADYVVRAEEGSRYLGNIRELHARCRRELGRPRFTGTLDDGAGALAVVSNVDGTSIKVNDLSYGATPLAPRVLAPGEVRVEASATGYLTDMRRATIVPGLVTDVVIELVKDPDYEAAPAPTVAPRVEEIPDIGWVAFRTGADNYAVIVDGKRVTLDDDGRWQGASGVHQVRIEAAGYEPWERRVRVVKGQNRSVEVQLVPAGERAAGRRTGWIALGVATAFTGVGIAFDALEANAREEAQDIFDREISRPVTGATGDVLPIRTREEMNDASDRARRNATISGVAYGLAAVSLGVSLYYLVENRQETRRGVSVPVTVVPVEDPAGGGAVGAAAVLQGEIDW